MPTQVQIRGAAQATQEVRTLASRELDVNTTDKRICIHDGSTAGGIPHVNYADHQNQEFVYAAATGTDAIAISLAIAPAAYQAGQKFCFKAANNNTGSATLNVNSLGAQTLKKKGSTLETLSADDIIAGGIYTVYYDGTDFIIELGGSSAGDVTAGTNYVFYYQPELYTNITTYVQTHRMFANYSGTIRIGFSIKNTNSSRTATLQIEKNSTSETTQSRQSTSYGAYTYDLNVNAGDIIDINIKSNGSDGDTYVKDLWVGVAEDGIGAMVGSRTYNNLV